MAIGSSSSSSSTSKWTYDVFLNFRGEDTRKNFVDHLYTALEDRSIYTFKDDQELKRGESISPELLKAIKQSKFAIVVFSTNYADSSWCLDELVKIVDCKNSICQTVLPVFYDVDPSEVRKQTGSYEKAFAKHETNGKYKEDQIQRWRNALAKAASISGWDIRNTADGHESHCIKQIVGNILKGISTTSSVDDNLIGLESRMQEVKSLLCTGLDDVQILGIWGMGGLGKTTVARAVFDDISYQFEGSSFVADVREVSKKNGLQFLQKQILSEILWERNREVCNVHNGIIMMKRLCHRRVLLVLDDVDQLNQLDALAGERSWFGKGSKIIITTRDKHVLEVHGVNEIHRVALLNDDEALLLFRKYALKRNSHPNEYVEPSRLLVRKVGELPLALKVLGSFLCGRNMVEWKSALERLKDVPENGILDVLKISFDGLKYIEQQIFLDIACFFVGMKKDEVSGILDSFNFYPDIGLSVLIQKSLVTVSNGTLQMHDLIKEMGWNIVHQMDPNEPGRRSRLWLNEDLTAVLKNDTGTEAIEGVKVKLGLTERLSILLGSEIVKEADRSQRQGSIIRQNCRAFENMKKLRLLDVYSEIGEAPADGLEYLSSELCWISWNGYPLKSLPASFQAKKLVCLNMPHSNIVELWRGRKILDKLKFIDLSESEELTRTPDFSGAPNLERLILCDCKRLKEVHPSLGDLKRLTKLDFFRCESLKSFSFDFNMTSLEILILSKCSKLQVFPQITGNMERLTELYLDGTIIKELHPSIEKLTGLVLMNLSKCKNLRHLPSTIDSFKCMKTLDLSGCTKLEELPENLGGMARLEELFLFETAITRPPSSIVLLKNLKTLSFGGSKLMSLSTFISSLFKKRSSESMGMVLQCLWGFLSIKKLKISYCNLLEIPGDLSQLYFLEELSLSGNPFTCLPNSLCQLSNLKVLDLNFCRRLEAVKKLPSSIAMLMMDDCESLESLGDLLTAKHEWLHEVSFHNCVKLTDNEQRSYSSGVFGFAEKLLQSMLQGCSVTNYQFSILVPGSEIPDWFTHQCTLEDLLDLQLIPNWHKRIMGFAICCVFRSRLPTSIIISLGLDYNKLLIFNRFYEVESDHVWMGYISLDFLREQIMGDNYKKEDDDWLRGSKESFIRILPEPPLLLFAGATEKWGIKLVYKEDVNEEMIEEDDNNSSQSVGNFGFFPTKDGVGHFYFNKDHVDIASL